MYDPYMDFIDFNYTAPILAFLIFLSLIMAQITDHVKKMLKVLFVLTIITSLMMAIFYLRYAKLIYNIHYLLIYLLIASYFLIILLKTKGITYLASYFISLIILVYFIPVIGQINYEKFISEEDRSIYVFLEKDFANYLETRAIALIYNEKNEKAYHNDLGKRKSDFQDKENNLQNEVEKLMMNFKREYPIETFLIFSKKLIY